MSFIVFCAFGVDTAFIVLKRFQLQKAVEMATLASAAHLKSGVQEPDLPSRMLALSEFPLVNITSFETKNVGENYRAKLSVEMPVDTYFLNFIGLKYVTIRATSAATTYIQELKDQQYGDILELDTIMTDKVGFDFSVESSYGYFVFAGVDTGSGNILWEDIGCKVQEDITPQSKTLVGEELGLLCDNASFDLSIPCVDKPDGVNIGIVKYLRVYKDPKACAVQPSATALNIKVLNNVKLMPTKDF